MLQFKCVAILGAARFAACLSMLWAVFVSPALAAVDHEALLRDRLIEVRELLERRQAHRHMLNAQIETLSLELDQLQLERQIALSELSEQVDQAHGYDVELDRLMPRILPRLKKLEAQRRQGAHAIAELAKIGRNANVRSEAKARFFAPKAVSIDQMRRASTSVRLLRRTPNGLIGKHRDLDFQIPLLALAVDRVSTRRDKLQRRRDSAFREIADLSVDIERLTAEEHRLARNMLARSLTATMRSSTVRLDASKIGIDRRNIGKSDLAAADVKSAASGRTQSRAITMPLDNVVGRASSGAKAMVPTMPGQPAGGKARAPVAGWANQGARERSVIRPVFREDRDVATVRAEPLSSLSSRVARGQIEESRPLVPTGETIGYTLADVIRQGDQSSIEIPATPWQRVAAPEDGLVVFANDFRSYGLLLIIEHDSEYHTLLWGFSSLDIEVGDLIQAGQIVGTAGTGQSPKLNVELRRNGEPVNPEGWLAASNSGVKG